MSFDSFASYAPAVSDPARGAFTVAPHDTNELATLPRALYVGSAGNLVLRAVDSNADVTLKNVAAGQVIDVRARYVRATGTTAADIVAFA